MIAKLEDTLAILLNYIIHEKSMLMSFFGQKFKKYSCFSKFQMYF